MISRRIVTDVLKASHRPGDTQPCISLFLNTDLGTRSSRERDAVASSLVAEARKIVRSKSSNSPAKDALHALDEIEQWIRENLRTDGVRGLAVFARGDDVAMGYRLPVPLEDRVYVGSSYAVRPIVRLFDRYPSMLLAMVHRDGATLHRFSFSRLDDIDELESDVPPHVRESGWYGLDERRIERHVDEHLHRHVRGVVSTIAKALDDDHYDFVAVAAAEDVRSTLMDALPEEVRSHMTDPVTFDPGDDRRTIARKAEDALRAATSQKEEMILESATETPPARLASGTEEVIVAAIEGGIDRLYIEDGRSEVGFACPLRHALSLDPGGCPLCGRPLETRSDILDETVEIVLSQGGHVSHLFREGILAEHGGVLAFLRYSRTPTH